MLCFRHKQSYRELKFATTGKSDRVFTVTDRELSPKQILDTFDAPLLDLESKSAAPFGMLPGGNS